MRRLICAFVLRRWHKQVFLMTWLSKFWKFTVGYLLIAKCMVWKWWQISYLSLWNGFKRLHLFCVCENAKTDWYDILCTVRSLIFNASIYRIKCSCQNEWILSPFVHENNINHIRDFFFVLYRGSAIFMGSIHCQILLQDILNCNENKYIKYIYKMMLADLEEYPNKINWSYLIKDLLSRGQSHKTAKQELP